MKTLFFEFNGSSKLVYVYGFRVDILEKLSELDAGEYDFLDFCSAYACQDFTIGDGLDLDCDVKVRISCDDEIIFSQNIRYFSPGSQSETEIEEEFQAEFEDPSISYKTSITIDIGSESEKIDGSNFYFPDDSDFLYCAIEEASCYSATGSVTVEVEDEFTLSEIRPVVADIDSGGVDSLMQKIYYATGLEHQLIGLRYKEKFFPISADKFEGGSNQVFFYKNTADGWQSAGDVEEQISDLSAF